MSDLSTGMFIALVVVQVVIFVLLVLVMIRLVKVIKSQNNGKVLPPDLAAKLRRMFGGSGKS